MTEQPADLVGLTIALLFLFVAALVGIFDLYMVLVNPPNSRTVSNFIVQWSHQWPIIPLCVGVVIGHIFFPTGGAR
jgi:hypothetical protein